MLYVQAESRGRHQRAGDNCPGSNEQHEGKDGKARPEEGTDTHGDIKQACED
jgi:hypothetical protein